MKPLVDPALEAYCAASTTPVTELHERLKTETYADVAQPQMQVGPIEGRLLMLLVRLSGARRALEIGTYTGYSALNIAEGLPDDGQLICLDRDPETAAIARRYWEQSPWGHKIELRLGEARELLEAVPDPIDFVFIDADKKGYAVYWEALIPRLPSGALVVVDNVLWSGRVLDPKAERDHAIVAFNAMVAKDERVEQVMLSVRDGVTIARKL